MVFGSDHNLLAYDPVTGGLMWAFTSGLYAVSAVGSAPTVGDGTSSGLRFDGMRKLSESTQPRGLFD